VVLVGKSMPASGGGMAMITSQQVDELARLHPGRFPVTTLFLRLESGPDKRKAEIQLKDLIKNARAEVGERGLDREQMASVERDWEALGEFVHHLDRKGHRGVAVFSSSGAGLWQTHLLAQPVRDRLVVDAHPHVRPLSRLLSPWQRSLVVRLGRNHAVLDWVQGGELAPIESRSADVPPELKAGGFAGTEERRLERHAEVQLLHFVRELVDRAQELLRGQPRARLLIGGGSEAMAIFETSAPAALKEHLVGRIAVGPDTGPAEVTKLASVALLAYERERAVAHATQAVRDAEGGGRAVVGIAASLGAFNRGQAALIVVDQGLVRPGFACGACLALVLDGDRCPECGAALVRVPDLVEELIHRAAGHAVEVLDADDLTVLAPYGGMAAILRYRDPRLDSDPIQVGREAADKIASPRIS
jgi:peptide subunit release factor 1 (eRF1)